MPTRDPRPQGVQWISPYITVKDAKTSADFYQKAFGFTLQEALPDEAGKVLHAELRYKTDLIMLGSEGAYGSPIKAPITTGVISPMSLYIYCDDVDAFYKQAITAGAKTELEPQDMFWGDRMCKLIDPDGHIWCFATHKSP